MSVNARLKELREAAYPPLSQRAMAAALGLSKSAYHLYESESANAFKQRYLPMDLARRAAAVLADHSINPHDVLALAGLEPGEGTELHLSATEMGFIELLRAMTDEQRKLMMSLAEQVVGRKSADRVNQDIPRFTVGHASLR